MPPIVFDNRLHDFGFVVSEGNGQKSREQGILAADAVNVRQPGTVLGKLTANGRLVPYNPAGADGSENFAGILGFRTEPSAATTRVTYFARDGEVNRKKLVYVNALDAAQQAALEAAMAEQDIVVR